MIHFFKSHLWNPEVLNFTNCFVPLANSCPMGLLFGHLGSHIEYPLDSKNRGKVGVGVTILIITSVILVYFQQMRYQNLKNSIPKILRPVTFRLVNYERSGNLNTQRKQPPNHKSMSTLWRALVLVQTLALVKQQGAHTITRSGHELPPHGNLQTPGQQERLQSTCQQGDMPTVRAGRRKQVALCGLMSSPACYSSSIFGGATASSGYWHRWWRAATLHHTRSEQPRPQTTCSESGCWYAVSGDTNSTVDIQVALQETPIVFELLILVL